MIKLYSYWRSSAAYRVRIVLNLKNLNYEIMPVHLVKEGGEQHSEGYKSINPQSLVPTLIDDNITLSQSMAILEYLEEKYPEFSLLPKDIVKRASARQFAQSIVSDIHPLNNLRVLKYLSNTLKVDEDAKDTWYQHWVVTGLDTLEIWLRAYTGLYCLGNSISIVDVCLIPQLYNAHRFNIPMENYPRLLAIETECLKLQAFDEARPEKQEDATASS